VPHEQSRLAAFGPQATDQISKIVKSLEADDAKEKRKLAERKMEEEGGGPVKPAGKKSKSESGKVSLRSHIVMGS
jgi:hypothetical protein